MFSRLGEFSLIQFLTNAVTREFRGQLLLFSPWESRLLSHWAQLGPCLSSLSSASLSAYCFALTSSANVCITSKEWHSRQRVVTRVPHPQAPVDGAHQASRRRLLRRSVSLTTQPLCSPIHSYGLGLTPFVSNRPRRRQQSVRVGSHAHRVSATTKPPAAVFAIANDLTHNNHYRPQDTL